MRTLVRAIIEMTKFKLAIEMAEALLPVSSLEIAPPCLIKYQYARESYRGTWPAISESTFHHTNSMSVMTIAFHSLKYELLSQYRMQNALIDVMYSNNTLHSVLFHDLDTFNTRNARTRSMASPSMSKPFLLHVSTHSLLSACFLLSAYFLAVQSYKRMCLTTSVYGIRHNFGVERARSSKC